MVDGVGQGPADRELGQQQKKAQLQNEAEKKALQAKVDKVCGSVLNEPLALGSGTDRDLGTA